MTKCFVCKKKIKGIEFLCNCKNIFCTKCRLPEAHKCTFDFKTKGRKQLENKLVKVISNKIKKI